MGARILGIGAGVPDKVLDNKYFEQRLDTTDEWIVTRTGIRERRVAPDGVQGSDLAVAASRKAMAMAGVAPTDIDAVIVATVTPDTPFPSSSCWVQAKLGVPPVPCFDVGAGCSGFLFGYEIADGLIAAGKFKKPLVIGVEMLSRVTDWEDRTSCVLFGDGAGAAVVGASDDPKFGLLASTWGADGSLGELLIQPAGGSRMPATHETVDKRLHTLKMKGNEVYKHAVKAMQQATMEAIGKAGVSAGDIALFVPHQANMRIITATAERVGVPMDRVMVTIDRYGNTSSASIPTALADAATEGRIKPGDIVVCAAFGAGFTWGAQVIRW